MSDDRSVSGLYRIHDGIYIVAATPTLYFEDNGLLVFADTHLGFEEEMARQGVFIPRAQLRRIISTLDRVFSLLKERGVKTVLINGDVKHSFDKLTRQEKYEVKALLDYLFDKVDRVLIVRGNHDNYLPIVTKDYGIELMPYHEIVYRGRKIVFTHGHVIVDVDADLIIIGHEHPSIALIDSLGLVTKAPCFLYMKLDIGSELIVLPSMGAYQSGTRVTLDRASYLSPYIREHGILENAKPYVIEKDYGVMELPELSTLMEILGSDMGSL